MSAQDLAERAGVSRGLIQRIEKGDPGCEIGVVFEVAALVGVKLFASEDSDPARRLKEVDERLALLPKHTHPPRKADDEF